MNYCVQCGRELKDHEDSFCESCSDNSVTPEMMAFVPSEPFWSMFDDNIEIELEE